MNDLEFLLSERERLWNSHPLIKQSAVLPTRAVQQATKRVLEEARKSRASVAFWADPLSGKTSCLRMIAAAVKARIPGCGVLFYEAVEDERPAEGRLLAELLTMTGFALHVDHSLAGKRLQVHRSLMTLAGPAQHLFLLADEAQEISDPELGWLKAVVNRLAHDEVKVTVVLAGQRELKRRREELLTTNARSDLSERFMKSIFEFKGCMSVEDVKIILKAIDSDSKFPSNRPWTYTHFFFPRAYEHGFRLEPLSAEIWSTIGEHVPAKLLQKGLSMESVAGLLAQICILAKELDGPEMQLNRELLSAAIEKGI